MDKKREVLEALADWVIHTVNNKALATPEEIAALPKVAQVFFENYSSDYFLDVEDKKTTITEMPTVKMDFSENLFNGTTINLNIEITTENFNPKDVEDVLSFISQSSRQFYLKTAKAINSMP